MKSILKPGYKFGYREHSWIGVRIILAALLFGLFSLAQAEVNNGASATIPDLEMFVREGCAHCEEAERFVARLCQERPALQVTIRDIFKDAGALERLRELAAGAVRLASRLPRDQAGRHVAAQFIRSATGGGANYQEARAAESRDDFAHKASVAAKEIRETAFWVALIERSGWVPGDAAALLREANELAAILGASVRTARARAKSASEPSKPR
mgnify:CR=1 FL=1